MLTDDEIMAQVLAAFQEEQAEHRQTIGELLLELEQPTRDARERRAVLDRLFRATHSLKGGARAAGQPEVEQLAHQVEDLFSALRADRLQLSAAICDQIYTALEAIGALMAQVAAGHAADLTPYQPLLRTLSAIAQDDPATAPIDIPAPIRAPTNGAWPADETRTAATQVVQPDEPGPPLEPAVEAGPDRAPASVRIATKRLDALLNETGELIACTVRHRQRTRAAARLLDPLSRWPRIWRQARPAYLRVQERMAAAIAPPTVHYLPEYGAARPKATPPTEREVSTLLHALTEAQAIISDLEQRLAQHVREIAEDSAQLEAVAERLQTQVRHTRMQPLATLWGPLRLHIREMARDAGKQVTLELDDGGAEADRQVLDRLRDVLLHLLRNAVDHGIELPAQRLAAGKAVAGRLLLRAAVSGATLTLTLADDGAGLDLAAIGTRAMAGGLLSAAELARLGPAELAELIFMPGFSTCAAVSTLSGRGVGLDIVRAQVERMHGQVTVTSTPGAGCCFTLRVPLALTSIRGLLLDADGGIYALPLDAVQRIVAAIPALVQQREGRAALLLDGRPIPLAHLGDVLGSADTPAPTRRGGPALVFGGGDRQVACLVDTVLGEQELVIQPLPPPLQQVRGVAGAAILADGRVTLILDIVDLQRGVIGTPSRIGPIIAPTATRRKPRVVIADDSITTRTLEKNILTAAGYEVRLASDGTEALAQLRTMADDGGCDLLLSDVDMPRLNGFELTAQIRADRRLQHLPVVLVTSLDTPADRERGIAAGADAYLVKRGFDQQVLLDTIASLI